MHAVRILRPAAGLLALGLWQRRDADAFSAESRRVAQEHVATLATSAGTPYTLAYLDKSTKFTVWRSTGVRSSFTEMLAAAASAEVVLLGETHYDQIAHKLQEIIFARLAAERPCALSLEMFETDVQHVVDEYVAGLTREQDMLRDARPWANYSNDYRPLVELAKAASLPVVASNAPRRYVGAVGRDGDALRSKQWSPRAYADLPPLPLPTPSAAYTEHLLADPEVVPRELEQGNAAASRCPYIGLKRTDGLVAPMLLWDATMAHAICRCLERHPSRLVVHLCGSFHCERRLGVVEMVDRYRPGTRQLVVSMYDEWDCQTFVEGRHAGAGDFVVLTQATRPSIYAQHAGEPEAEAASPSAKVAGAATRAS